MAEGRTKKERGEYPWGPKERVPSTRPPEKAVPVEERAEPEEKVVELRTPAPKRPRIRKKKK